MTLTEIRKLIDANGGKREYLINWEWANFPSSEIGQAVFDQIKDHCETRGFNNAQPDNSNPNLRRAAFRFR